MKVEQHEPDTPFEPVTITLETAQEFIDMRWLVINFVEQEQFMHPDAHAKALRFAHSLLPELDAISLP